MSIVTADVRSVARYVNTTIKGFEKNQAHRRHRQNQREVLNRIQNGQLDAEDDAADFSTKPCTGWDIW